MGDRGSGIGDGGRGEREEGSGKWEVVRGRSNARMLERSIARMLAPHPRPSIPDPRAEGAT